MKALKKFLAKYGYVVASCAFLFGTIAANSNCCLPYYEPAEPAGLQKYKKFNKHA